MKIILITLSVLVTLSHTTDHDEEDKKTATANWLIRHPNPGAYAEKYLIRKRARDKIDSKMAKKKAVVLRVAKQTEDKLNDDTNMLGDFFGTDDIPDKPALRLGYHMDPVLNEVRRSNDFRRKRGDGTDEVETDAESNSRSSSREFNDWKVEWKELWLQKKLEALNYSDPGGDRVNMVAARPWGVPCGDPVQHDMPWGTCVLPAECSAEYRIYRGDYFCGRTQFVCCSLMFHSYDLYQGIDVSLAQTSMETDSADERDRQMKKSSVERRKRAARRRRRRKRLRQERKRRIRKTITKIVKEVRKILNKAFKNGTKMRKKKTRTMKNFIKFLKKQYRMDRESAKDIHENQMFEVDQRLMEKLVQIKDLNSEFMTNDTFRDILAKGTISAKAARMLAEAYPDLTGFIARSVTRRVRAPQARRGGALHWRESARRQRDPIRQIEDAYRRRGDNASRIEDAYRRRGDNASRTESAIRRRGDIYLSRDARRKARRRKYLDYDVEYGLLYS